MPMREHDQPMESVPVALIGISILNKQNRPVLLHCRSEDISTVELAENVHMSLDEIEASCITTHSIWSFDRRSGE